MLRRSLWRNTVNCGTTRNHQTWSTMWWGRIVHLFSETTANNGNNQVTDWLLLLRDIFGFWNFVIWLWFECNTIKDGIVKSLDHYLLSFSFSFHVFCASKKSWLQNKGWSVTIKLSYLCLVETSFRLFSLLFLGRMSLFVRMFKRCFCAVLSMCVKISRGNSRRTSFLFGFHHALTDVLQHTFLPIFDKIFSCSWNSWVFIETRNGCSKWESGCEESGAGGFNGIGFHLHKWVLSFHHGHWPSKFFM